MIIDRKFEKTDVKEKMLEEMHWELFERTNVDTTEEENSEVVWTIAIEVSEWIRKEVIKEFINESL